MRSHRVIGLAMLAVGALSATVMPYTYTTTGAIAGSPANLVFNPRSTAVFGSTNGNGSVLDLALGSFTLSRPGVQTAITYNNSFTLNFAFTSPIFTSTSFNGFLSGVLNPRTGQSDADFIVSPSSRVVRFASPYNGSFLVTVHDILDMSYSGGERENYTLRGDITHATDAVNPANEERDGVDRAAIPEPASVFLLLTVVGGLVITMRRRIFRMV
jgi:hypothetical protein